MKENYFLKTLFFLSIIFNLSSCSKDDNEESYAPIPPVQVSPVSVDLTKVPYQNLSEYRFFEGAMKDMAPAYKVIPYDLSSTLFTDYAHKKRFIWMPKGKVATYSGDANAIDFPDGTVLIKNFYYDNVQPGNTRKIIETRLMIMKDRHWIFANYIWNDSQTEALLDMNGANIALSWIENGTPMDITYRIPSEAECFTCHKNGEDPAAIGPKPQNLNKAFTYTDGSMNQLSRWIQEGYLNSVPQNIASAVDWTDTSKPLEMRVRSYLDINCAHCHRDGSHCDYRPIRLALNETANPENLGVCVNPHEFLSSGQQFIVQRGNYEKSVMYYRMQSIEESDRMPLMGRTIQHTEALDLMQQWITSLGEPCQ